ncbi:GIY-YIG nuclease family protein [Escherichia coli]|nr:GIY-YIG nuclease family protein [Escherichia coli]
MRKLTHEEQVAVIADVNPDVEVIGEITGNKTKVTCRCKVCRHEWSSAPCNLKRGYGCPKCAGNAKLTHEELVVAIAKVNPDVEVIGEITGNKTKVTCRCKVCRHEWSSIPCNLKRGQGCPKCAGNAKLTHEEQVANIVKANHDVEVLGKITGNAKKVLCRCKVCNHKWLAKPGNLKCGHGCPKCAKYGFLSHDYGKLYIMVDDPEVPTVMKVGVSVKENKRRNEILKSAHKAGVRIPDLCVVKTLEGPTENIHKLESTMHKAFSDYKINFPVKFNGGNEFFYYRPEVFDMVEEAYKEIVCCQ